MKIALITTTINVPTVLELYRRYGPAVAFFVAGDHKTPSEAAIGSDAPHFMDAAYQKSLNYKCSELIGWNCIQRRNIALLEAVKWGADVVVSIDDDNIPMGAGYFDYFKKLFVDYGKRFAPDGDIRPLSEMTPAAYPAAFNGLKVSSPNGWFDVGQLLDPISSHRGFPYDVESKLVVSHSVGAKVGVAAGICLGDPDIGAVTRLVLHPEVHRVSQLLESGIVVDPGDPGSHWSNATWTVYNSQNTAFIRELAPAMFMMPGVGRYDDIYASLICQRIMHSRGYHVHFGKPFVWQQRNPHNLTKDLRAEIDGMERVEQLQAYLNKNMFATSSAAGGVIEELRAIYAGFDKLPYSYDILPKKSVVAALAFLDDIEQVMG